MISKTFLSYSFLHLFSYNHASTKSSKRSSGRRNVEEQGVPNAPEVQPEEEVTNVEFREAIRMFSQVVINYVGQHRGARQEETDTSRIPEFLRMNPPSFTGSSTSTDLENFIDEFKKVFDVMYIDDIAGVDLAAYQTKDVSIMWFN